MPPPPPPLSPPPPLLLAAHRTGHAAPRTAVRRYGDSHGRRYFWGTAVCSCAVCVCDRVPDRRRDVTLDGRPGDDYSVSTRREERGQKKEREREREREKEKKRERKRERERHTRTHTIAIGLEREADAYVLREGPFVVGSSSARNALLLSRQFDCTC